jgi:hypothetical protein
VCVRISINNHRDTSVFMSRHKIAQWSFKGRQLFTSRLDATSQNPQQDCCGNLKCVILFKMAVSSSSVLSANFLHTQSLCGTEPGSKEKCPLEVAPSAATTEWQCSGRTLRDRQTDRQTGDTSLCRVAAVDILGPTGLHF